MSKPNLPSQSVIADHFRKNGRADAAARLEALSPTEFAIWQREFITEHLS